MASSKRDPMSADLLRQRRNLLVTSLVLTAINLAGASLKKDVSVLGASLEFSNPERIVWGVWVLWLYFFVRYWQYLNEEPDLGIHKAMGHWILRRFSWDETDRDYQHWIFWRYCILWSLCEQHESWDSDHWSRSSLEPKSKFRKFIWAFRAFFFVAAKTPRFTDYAVPFIVALTPVLLAAWDLLSSWRAAFSV